MTSLTSTDLGHHAPHRLRTFLAIAVAVAATVTLVVMVFAQRQAASPPAPAAPAAPASHQGCHLTADAAAAWLGHGACGGPAEIAGRPCSGSADAAEHWIRSSRRLPGCIS